MRNGFFYIKGAQITGEKLVLNGDYIVPGTLEVNAPKTGASSSSSPPPPEIPILGRFTVKWILPARGTQMYAAEKAAAEAAGYETVEQDDFSYPGPRV